ncbi:asparagine-rich protein-like [Vanessa atalanta]|uniref:asparagine-rich protein-like n=1 Tax=Vanessa atalanta TaxID=42275 RepID=UPI001FCD7658|nr:asparagine-rich protein-like [Vanessa atalanta]
MRYHHPRYPDRFQNSGLDSDEFTKPSDVVNDVPSETFKSGLFDPSFNEPSFNLKYQDREDSSENSMGIREYCEKNTDFKDTRSEGYEKNEEYNDYYDNGRESLDGLESLKKLKAYLCKSIINKPKESNIDFIKGKDKLNINNEEENTEFNYFPKINSESNLNKLKTNNVNEKNMKTSQTDRNDSTDVNLNRNPKFSIVSEGFEQSKEVKNNIPTQTPHNAPSVLSDQIFNSYGNNQPSPLPLSYPTYLSNLFRPNGSPVTNIPPIVNTLNNGTQYNNQPFLTPNVTPIFYNQLPGTFVTNDNIVPIPNIALRNLDSGITNGYTLVAIPNNGYTGTNGLGFIDSALNQNSYSEQQPYNGVQLNNGQNALVPSNYVQMVVSNNKQSSVQDDSQTLIPSYDQITVTSTDKNIPLTQDNSKIFVSNNTKQISLNDADGQDLSPNDFEEVNQKILSIIFGNEQIQNAESVQKEDQPFENQGASVSSSNGDNNS